MTSIIENQFTQSQSHGFFWENQVRCNVFGLPQETNSTATHDIVLPNENISIIILMRKIQL